MTRPGDSDQQRRQLIERVLERIAADPEFRRQLLDDPQQALRDAGFAQEIEQLLTRAEAEAYALALGDSPVARPSPVDTSGESRSNLSTQLLFAAFTGMLLRHRAAEDLPAPKPDIDRSKVIDYTRTKEMG